MLAKAFAVVLLLSVAFAEPDGERKPQSRQFSLFPAFNQQCPEYYQLNTNPCPNGGVYFSISSDPFKFVQCDSIGRIYVIQCPSGLQYNAMTTSCEPPHTAVIGVGMGQYSFCTAQALQSGQVYFPVTGDNTHFYQCNGIGQAQALQCPQGLVFDAVRLACVYAPSNNGYIVTQPLYPYPQQVTNPCAPQQIASGHYYFSHPDPTKFIQCDTAGQAFVVSCPSGLVWNQYATTCGNAYSQTIGLIAGK